MAMTPSNLTKFMTGISDKESIYQEAEKYRYFKCFRSQSKGWRKPCPYNVDFKPTSPSRSSASSPEKAISMARHTKTWPMPTANLHAITLPSISCLGLTFCNPPVAMKTMPTHLHNEDAKQLSLLTGFLF
ncbi:hypothetical protein DSO57_1018877 [Entomophthora muscae]|uniref:Uncharacterized protein n=1 Tax=Entomophthora muscae TaxID=34485 RepID=A0ACC2S6D1_9FUNG|nr:hypothetical protein DSO57_1018877 [Entomophthora muscae]